MLQIINNQDMEFGSLFDAPQFTGPPELPVLSHSTSAPSPPTSAPSSSPSSIQSSSPHLDALLGPPITRSSSSPDKAFHPPTFQQSPLAQVASPRQQQQQTSPSQAPASQGPRQSKADQPAASPPTPTRPQAAASPLAPAGQSPAFSSLPQGRFTSPAPQQQQPQPLAQPQLQTQAQPQQQARINYTNQNGYTGEDMLAWPLCVCVCVCVCARMLLFTG